MAKTECKCRYILSITQAPNDIQLGVYTGREWEEIMDCDIFFDEPKELMLQWHSSGSIRGRKISLML